MAALAVRLHQVAMAASFHSIRSFAPSASKMYELPADGKTLWKTDQIVDASTVAAWGGWIHREYRNAQVYQWIRKSGTRIHMTLSCQLYDADDHRIEEKQIHATVDAQTHELLDHRYLHDLFLVCRKRRVRYIHCLRMVFGFDFLPAWRRRLIWEAATACSRYLHG